MDKAVRVANLGLRIPVHLSRALLYSPQRQRRRRPQIHFYRQLLTQYLRDVVCLSRGQLNLTRPSPFRLTLAKDIRLFFR